MRDDISGYCIPKFSFLLNLLLPCKRMSLDRVLAADIDHMQSYNDRFKKMGMEDQIETLCSGSHFEGLEVPLRFVKDTIDLPDVDVMFVIKWMIAGCGVANYEYIIDSSDTHVGYLRIWKKNVVEKPKEHLVKVEDLNRYYLSSENLTTGLKKVLVNVKEKNSLHESHGPAVMKTDMRKWSSDMLQQARNDSSLMYHRDIDIVISLPCPEWPSIAMEWITRERQWNWPPESIISTALSEGCHIVGSAFPRSICKNLEWRLSFSKIEKFLARSLNETQRKCYIFMKILLKSELNFPNILCSYHIKTILFWLCEQRNPDLWCLQNLGACLLEMIDKLEKCLIAGWIEHYFIRNNNLLCHVHEDFLETLIKKLQHVRKDPLSMILKAINHGRFIYSPDMEKYNVLFEPTLEKISNQSQALAIDYNVSFEQTLYKIAKQYMLEGRKDLVELMVEEFNAFLSESSDAAGVTPFHYLIQLISRECKKVNYVEKQIEILEQLRLKWNFDADYCSRICRQLGEFYQMKAHLSTDPLKYDVTITKAEEVLLSALEMDSSLSVNHFYIAKFWCEEGKYDEIEQALLTVIEMEKLKHTGHCLFTSVHATIVDKYLKSELDQHLFISSPMIILAYYYLTVLYHKTDREDSLKGILSEFEQAAYIAVMAKPEFVSCLVLLGYSYYFCDDVEKAKETFAMAASHQHELNEEAVKICSLE